jgi:hypothetical protein
MAVIRSVFLNAVRVSGVVTESQKGSKPLERLPEDHRERVSSTIAR